MHSFAIYASLLSLIATLGAGSPAAAGVSAGHAGFTLPANLSSGLYTAYFDSTGKEIHELISTDLPTGSPVELSLEKRQQYADNVVLEFTLCGCGFNVDVADCNGAVAGLENWAGNGRYMAINIVEYVIYGSVVAFVCSNNGEDGPSYVSAQSLAYDASVITSNCGSYVAGTLIDRFPGTYWVYAEDTSGYMQYINGMNICGAARYGTTNYC